MTSIMYGIKMTHKDILLTFVVGDGCQVLDSTPMFLAAGLARRLGGCQGHGGRAGEVARLQEQDGEITAATLGGSWGAVPIRNIEDLPGKGWVMTLSWLFRTTELWGPLGSSLGPCFHPLFITHSDSRTPFPQVTDFPTPPAPSKGKPLLFLPQHFVLFPGGTCSRVIIAYLSEWFLNVSPLSGCKPEGRGLLCASHQDAVTAVGHYRTSMQNIIMP